MQNSIKKVIVVGSGASGGLAALAMQKFGYDVTWVAGGAPIGVGESTTSAFKGAMDYLGIPETRWMPECQATYKAGIEFHNWKTIDPPSSFLHPFGVLGDTASYGFHLDAKHLAQLLKHRAMNNIFMCPWLVTRINEAEGRLVGLTMESGLTLTADVYIDCTGFARRLTQGRFLSTISYDRLTCKQALVANSHNERIQTLKRFWTGARALKAGWLWTIPLLTGNRYGYVYDPAHVNVDDAMEEMVKNVCEPISEPTVIKFETYRLENAINSNVISIGLAGGFIEPLESTGLNLTCESIYRLKDVLASGLAADQVYSYNKYVADYYDTTADFVELHYNLTQRCDTPFWESKKQLRPSQDRLIELYNSTGLKASMFGKTNYRYILEGMGREIPW